MTHAILVYLPWLLSAITIWMTLLAGNMSRAAWPVGIANQALWLVWILTSQNWGMLPMNIALAVVCWRNYVKWKAA